jgi:hypothetical protein
MMTDSVLGYRSYFLVDRNEEPNAETIIVAQLQSWLRSKRYNVDSMRFGHETEISPGVVARLLRIDGQDGASTLQASVVEETASNGIWESQVTVHTPSRESEPALVLLDISGPIAPRTPRLARLLTAAVSARDGSAILRDKPMRVKREDVEQLVDAVRDPRRRGLLFVSGMSSGLPREAWYQYVSGLLHQTTGLAASYFLDSEATEAFAIAMGDSHAVAPGTVRTFMPGVDVLSDLDALRHRILSTDRILKDSGSRLATFLGRRAQEEALRAELPPKMLRLRRQLTQRSDELWLAEITTLPPTELSRQDEGLPLDVATDGRAPADAAKIAEPIEHVPADPAADPAVESEGTNGVSRVPVLRWMDSALRALRRVFKIDDPEQVDWEELADLAIVGRQARTAQASLAHQLSLLRDRADDAEASKYEVDQRLEDEQLEHAATQDALDSIQRRNSYLEGLVQRTDLVGELYDESGQLSDDPVQDFEDLLSRVDDLEFVAFTGDSDITLALGVHDPLGGWARKVWEVLQVLEDYASASSDGRCTTGVHGYLLNTPEGCKSYSANKHAATESEAVQKNKKFSDARLLPVPAEIVEGGVAPMLAHFKIAKFGMVSPRLHYLDDTAKSGKVYVGHIGPHLPTQES